jgi:hypothetical protein
MKHMHPRLQEYLQLSGWCQYLLDRGNLVGHEVATVVKTDISALAEK